MRISLVKVRPEAIGYLRIQNIDRIGKEQNDQGREQIPGKSKIEKKRTRGEKA